MNYCDEKQFFKAGAVITGLKADFRDTTSAVDHVGIMFGAGSAADPVEWSDASKNGATFYTKATAADGSDSRGLYWKHFISGISGSGEAGRFFTSISGVGAVGVHGVHASVEFTGSGTCTGEGAALRATFHVPSKTLGGTNAAVYAELWADGALSNANNLSMFRAVLGGDGTGKALLEDVANLIRVEGGTNASGNMIGAQGNEPTWASNTYLGRCNINGVAMGAVFVGL